MRRALMRTSSTIRSPSSRTSSAPASLSLMSSPGISSRNPWPWRPPPFRKVMSKSSSTRCSVSGAPTAGLLRVDDLAHRSQLAAQVLVLLHLAIDLLAGVEHGGVVAAAQLGADAQERHLGLGTHQV